MKNIVKTMRCSLNFKNLNYHSPIELPILDSKTSRVHLWFCLSQTNNHSQARGKKTKEEKASQDVHLKGFLSVRARTADT